MGMVIIKGDACKQVAIDKVSRSAGAVDGERGAPAGLVCTGVHEATRDSSRR